MSVKVKICGIRNLETAKVALDAGADYIGLNFVPTSRRKIDVTIAQQIISNLKGKIEIVGVFQNQPLNEIMEILDMCNLDIVQLHGNEDRSFSEMLQKKVLKVFPLSETIQEQIKDYSADYYMIDRVIQGTGEMVDFSQAEKIAREYKLFFAGGLTPENIADVVKHVKPYAVDVAGGIEIEGKEDAEKMKNFIKNAKGVII